MSDKDIPIFEFENGFFPDKCPLCGRDDYISVSLHGLDMNKLQAEVVKQYSEEAEPLEKAVDNLKNDLEELLMWKEEQEKMIIPGVIDWIYTKVWKERSWVCVKPGKTRDILKREKQYDDHDYILNLCAPVYRGNEHEQHLKDVLFKVLIPTILGYRDYRMQLKLGEDFKHVQLKDGLAPGRNEYYRIFIDVESVEFDFLQVGLKTFFGGISGPNSPINYDEWIAYVKKMTEKGSQRSIFDDLESDEK